ncbi:MAG: UvrD-helicase domain-containing protein [Bacteroidaceae bacterium]|nr:UvrD-helicase domain-containing protein [Bacteroidaceae bacterium]
MIIIFAKDWHEFYLLHFTTLIIIALIGLLFVISASIYLYRLKRQKDALDYQITQTISKKDPDKSTTERKDSSADLIDLEAKLNQHFANHFITLEEENTFRNQFEPLYNKACLLQRRQKLLYLSPSALLQSFLKEYHSIHDIVLKHNQAILKNKVDENSDFFDHCLPYPLDEQQRRAIVSEADNCLVVSSAGSGKTSTIVGKVKYLIEKENVNPERILLISYTNKAASELSSRTDVSGLKGYTFHKLALDLIGQVTGIKPSVCDNPDALFVRIYHNLLSEKSFKESVLKFISIYQNQGNDWEVEQEKKRQYLSDQKSNKIRALLPDMDGNAIFVKSEQERSICFALSSLGIKFRYEEAYEYSLMDEKHSQYTPDFSIYYEKDGVIKRIYLEHLGVDEHGLVPLWFANDKGITYEEACQKYNDGITWKKAAHARFGTTLITTSSADFNYYNIKNRIRELLEKESVPIQQKTEEELYDLVLPENSKQEKAFIRLCVTFINLLKTNCKSFSNLLNDSLDERSSYILKNILYPIFINYEKTLKERGEIDFTDAIIQATELCKQHHPVSFEYIIVDEFQDISFDRYRFLKTLREGQPQAKLFCVGDDWQSIYRFSGSDAALFNNFADYFGPTDINKIETTYRFGEPLVSLSSQFILRNPSQINKVIKPFNKDKKTELRFCAFNQSNYCQLVERIVLSIPKDKSIFLLGRYSFDDYYLSLMYQGVKEGNKYYYIIADRKIEFLTVHKSKGLEADYVILLQCNKDTYGFPSTLSDDPILNLVLTKGDQYPFGEERRLFYVAITRAKSMTIILYDQRFPSVFVDEFLHPEKVDPSTPYTKPRNANKIWTRRSDRLLQEMYSEGKSIRYIAEKMGRSQTSIIMRLGKLGINM